jgi:hypothetical protein
MLKRQEKLGSAKHFSIRLPLDCDTLLEDFALERRLTKSAAITLLLEKSLQTEFGKPYTPEKRLEVKA